MSTPQKKNVLKVMLLEIVLKPIDNYKSMCYNNNIKSNEG